MPHRTRQKLPDYDIEPVRSPTAIGVLEDLQVRGLLQQGKAQLISVEAVRQALGRRWSERKGLVWDMIEAQIHRRIGPQDFSARLSDDTFLIITPLLPAASAQLLAVRILQDVLNHFLGESRPADISIKTVADFSAGEIACQAVPASDIIALLAREQPLAAPATPKRDATTAEDVGGVTTLDGRRLRFSSSVDPIIDLRRFAITGHRIEPKIQFDDSRLALSPMERRLLLPRDVQAVDLSTLRRGLSRLTSGESSPGKPSLIMTVSFLTLSNTRARTALLAEAGRARALMTRAVIWEITDFEEGLPPSRLEESVALLKPFCRSVFARRMIGGQLSRPARSFGISGLVAQSPLTLTREDDFALWLLSMGRAMEGQSPTLIATNLPSSGLLPVAASAGFTHATVRA